MNTITVTNKTTLGELLSILDLAEKSGKTPTPRELFETAGEPIAETNDCTLFRNGFAIYQNITGRTVVWLPYCKSFTFYFNKLRDSEKDSFRESYELPDGFLAAQPWILAVTLIGDHRIEANSMNRTGSRRDTTDYDSADNGDKDGDSEAAMEKTYEKEYVWRCTCASDLRCRTSQLFEELQNISTDIAHFSMLIRNHLNSWRKDIHE